MDGSDKIEQEINKRKWERWRARQETEREKPYFFCAPPPPQPSVLIAPQTTNVSPGETAAIEIRIDDVEDLAGTDIWLTYDSGIAEITEVQAVDFSGIAYTTTGTANNNNQMKINWADMANPKTTETPLVYARITFRAVGSAGQETTLQLEVKNLANSEFEEIDCNVSDGLIRIV